VSNKPVKRFQGTLDVIVQGLILRQLPVSDRSPAFTRILWDSTDVVEKVWTRS